LTTLDAQAVTIEGGLWARRQAVNREIALLIRAHSRL
jgi:hypothetical protein